MCRTPSASLTFFFARRDLPYLKVVPTTTAQNHSGRSTLSSEPSSVTAAPATPRSYQPAPPDSRYFPYSVLFGVQRSKQLLSLLTIIVVRQDQNTPPPQRLLQSTAIVAKVASRLQQMTYPSPVLAGTSLPSPRKCCSPQGGPTAKSDCRFSLLAGRGSEAVARSTG